MNGSMTNIQSLIFHATMAELIQLCDCIKNLPPVVKQRSQELLKTVFDADIFHSDPKMSNMEIFSCILYMSVIEKRVPYGVLEPYPLPQVAVMDILIATNVNINDLFRCLKEIGEKITLASTVQRHFSNLKKKYCVLSAMHHTFQGRLCSTVFRDVKERSPDDSLPPMPETEGLAYRKKLAWVLFLLAKHNLMEDSVELFEHFQLLLCCVEYVLTSTPTFLLNTPYDSIKFGYYNTENEPHTMLSQLVSDFEVDLSMTESLYENSTEPFFQQHSNCDGELDCDRLCEEYKTIYKQEGDLDELSFLSKNSLLIPAQISRLNSPTSNVHAKVLPQEMTPVKVAVNAVQHLNNDLSDVKEEAGNKLLSFYQKCKPDPSISIRHLLSDMKEMFLTSYDAVVASGTSNSAVGLQRWSLGIRLYQKVLERMILNLPKESLTTVKLSVLLSKEEFHKSMLACSLEVVLATYGLSWSQSPSGLVSDNANCSFPWILNVLDLQAYDFYKVVESFIKAESKLLPDVIKHLQNVEFQILDCLAWKEGSSLFDALGHCDMPIISAPMLSPVKTPSNGHSHAAKCSVELFLSPRKPRSSIAPPSALSSCPSKQEVHDNSEGSKKPKSQSLAHFFSRVSRLGYRRLCKLCMALNISKDIEHKVWTCFEYCITRKSILMKNRHLDQMVMCCIYGICKVTENDLLFKSIVNQYKSLPHARQEIYRNVYIKSDETDSIIGFYNRVFIQSMDSYIKQFSLYSKTTPVSPKPAPSPTYSLPGKKNFYISPLKNSPFKMPVSPSQLTPSKRLLYSFGESIGTPETFSMINEKMSAAKKRKFSVNKCLNFDA